jgi:hypothetical protein
MGLAGKPKPPPLNLQGQIPPLYGNWQAYNAGKPVGVATVHGMALAALVHGIGFLVTTVFATFAADAAAEGVEGANALLNEINYYEAAIEDTTQGLAEAEADYQAAIEAGDFEYAQSIADAIADGEQNLQDMLQYYGFLQSLHP